MGEEKTKPERSVRIVRHGTERDFTILRNDAVRDARLSWKATGLLVYIISLPDDWRLYLTDLAKRKKDGRDATRAGLAELEQAGYLSIEQVRDGGRFVETIWHVSDVPATVEKPAAEKPDSENPNTVNPDTEKPTLQRTDKKNTHERRTHPQRERAGGEPPAGRARGPSLSGGGGAGSKYQIDGETGVCLQPGNAQDLQALAEIKSHRHGEIEAAVAQTRATEPSGRAYPSAVLRSLRRGRGAGGPAGAAGTPAWALAGAHAHASRVGVQEIDITDEGEVL